MLDSYIQLSEYGAKTQVVKLANSGVQLASKMEHKYTIT
jgi:hypothetical protein